MLVYPSIGGIVFEGCQIAMVTVFSLNAHLALSEGVPFATPDEYFVDAFPLSNDGRIVVEMRRGNRVEVLAQSLPEDPHEPFRDVWYHYWRYYPTDMTMDGKVDINDLLDFLGKFRYYDVDWNLDGESNVEDLLDYLAEFRKVAA